MDETDLIADRIAKTAASIDAGIHRLLTDIRRFDLEEGWGRQGALSCAAWLCWRCGIALGAAREKVRVAHALAELPLLDEALRLGQISYSKVRAITRIASASNEASLCEMARYSTASQLEKICRLAGQLSAKPEAEAERWVRTRTTEGGMVRIEVQLRPEEAARVLKACDVSADSAETRLEGLLAMAEGVLRGESPDRPATEVLLHIDAETLTGHGEGCGIPAETSRRILCDAGIVPILEVDGEPLNVGRKTRRISGALRRALVARDEGCRFPGCSHDRFVHAHHVKHWIDGGETSLANAILLCNRHHTLVHEGGFSLVRDGEDLRFLDPRGRKVDFSSAEATALPDVDAPITTWDGERVDYGEAVSFVVS